MKKMRRALIAAFAFSLYGLLWADGGSGLISIQLHKKDGSTVTRRNYKTRQTEKTEAGKIYEMKDGFTLSSSSKKPAVAKTASAAPAAQK
jgi:hypothetical protein